LVDDRQSREIEPVFEMNNKRKPKIS
jgi:hypothetical protein